MKTEGNLVIMLKDEYAQIEKASKEQKRLLTGTQGIVIVLFFACLFLLAKVNF